MAAFLVENDTRQTAPLRALGLFSSGRGLIGVIGSAQSTVRGSINAPVIAMLRGQTWRASNRQCRNGAARMASANVGSDHKRGRPHVVRARLHGDCRITVASTPTRAASRDQHWPVDPRARDRGVIGRSQC
jgi:hypothetical protein